MLINEEHRAHFELTKETPYLIFTGVSYGVSIEFWRQHCYDVITMGVVGQTTMIATLNNIKFTM